MENLKLMCVMAHPDDETLATGGILARYAAEGVQTFLVTATRGEHGWLGPAKDYPGPIALGKIREAELRRAADTLGIHEVVWLDYIDGKLDQAAPTRIISQIVAHLRRARPHVVVTFDPYGAYGHPDHIAISQFTTAAVTAAAGAAEGEHFSEPHQVLKLYYLAETHANLRLYEEAFGELIMTIDDTERRATAWPDWAITTRINTTLYWRQVRQAVLCHRSQLPGYESLKNLPEDLHKELWGTQTFYRAMSLVNSGRQTEDDLFTGVRQPLQEHRII